MARWRSRAQTETLGQKDGGLAPSFVAVGVVIFFEAYEVQNVRAFSAATKAVKFAADVEAKRRLGFAVEGAQHAKFIVFATNYFQSV
jgi:hypothetical protein